MATTNLGFLQSSGNLANGILVPKYYDPSIDAALEKLKGSRELVRLGDLIRSGQLTVHYGHDIGKHYYGMGSIPYVRTSDLATWEVVSAPKQTVGREAYDIYAAKQDVRAGDVLFIRDGLYLIGRTALITEHDLPLIHQSHLIRFRAAPGARIDAALLMCLLSTPIVIRQVRAKQFTAGIIDKIEDRYQEIVLPVPAQEREREDLARSVFELINRRVALRERLKRIPLFAQGLIPDFDASVAVPAAAIEGNRLGYLLGSGSVRGNVLIPKYYDPEIDCQLNKMSADFEIRSIQSMVASGLLELSTGIEVGKLAYGLGEVPFIRTSDLADWELSGQPKQRVSQDLFDELRKKVDVRAEDILLVRDGTYLVGTSAILTRSDARALYAGGLYKIRVTKPDVIDPYLMLALLNMPIVKQQIRSKQFTRDIIDTLGLRLYEVMVPFPKSESMRNLIAGAAREVVEERALLRDRAKEIVLGIEGSVAELPEEQEAAAELSL